MPRLPGVGFLFVMALAGCGESAQPPLASDLKPCAVDEGPSDAYCTKVEVFENRSAASGRKIALQVVVLRAFKPRGEGSPLFVLAGGPGEAAAQSAARAQRLFRSMQRTRDIVLVDQRGTGASNPLDCAGDAAMTEEPATDPVKRAQACLARLESHADVRQYTTANAVDDLESVRRALGYGQVNLYGVSYGTRPAMLYARRYSEYTRSVVLDSVAPIAMTQPLHMPRDAQAALDRLARDCEANGPCSAAYPGLHERIRKLLAVLDAKPRRIENADPTTGLASTGTVDREVVSASLLVALYTAESSALVPFLVHRAEEGDYAGILAVRAASRAAREKLARGAYLSVLCNEDAPRIAPGSILAESAGTFIGPRPGMERLAMCAVWPKSAPAQPVDAIASNVPALLLAGELDPVTPPSWADYVAGRSARARQVVVPGTGHVTVDSGCVPELIGRFLDDPAPEHLDVSCLRALHRPRFFISPSGPQEAVE